MVGEIMLVEDTNDQGHLSKNILGQPFHCIFVVLE